MTPERLKRRIERLETERRQPGGLGCPQCGGQIATLTIITHPTTELTRFCHRCGYRVSTVSTVEPETPEPAA